MATETNSDFSSNPLGNELDITLQIPQNIEIQMVNAAEMTDYQVWSGIAAFLSNAVVGFFVSTITNNISSLDVFLWVIVGVFFILMIVSGLMAWYKMKHMKKGQRPIKFGAVKRQ